MIKILKFVFIFFIYKFLNLFIFFTQNEKKISLLFVFKRFIANFFNSLENFLEVDLKHEAFLQSTQSVFIQIIITEKKI